jgi:hypothetical protein
MPAGFSKAALVISSTALRGALGGIQAHKADPGTGGASNKSSAAMAVPAWTNPDANGNFDLVTPVALAGGEAGGPITWISFWSNTSGSGVWYGNYQLSGDLVFDSSGQYNIESIPVTASTS